MLQYICYTEFMKSQPFALQAGLTLLEMVIGLSVIVLLLVLTMTIFNQNSSRAQSLEAKMQLVRAGVLRFQTDLPCGPATLSALTRREDAAVGLCGDSNNLNNWRGPYIDSGSTYVNGDSDISTILSGASLAITQQVVNSLTGRTIYTILKVSAISDEMRSAVVALCSDDCTPYKNITGDTGTIGMLVSRFSFQAPDQGADVVAFGVTPPVLIPTIVLPPLSPTSFGTPSATETELQVIVYYNSATGHSWLGSKDLTANSIILDGVVTVATGSSFVPVSALGITAAKYLEIEPYIKQQTAYTAAGIAAAAAAAAAIKN